MRAGQTLMEILVAVGVVMVGLFALIQISTKSVSNSGFAKRQAMATALVVEGMEWIKNARQGEPWGVFYGRGSGGGSIYCLNNLTWAAGGCSGATIANTEFIRTATLYAAVVTPPPSGPANQQLRVVVEVSWYESSGRLTSSRQETVFLRY